MKKMGSGNHVLERWEGISNMKYFYACPEIPVNHQEIKEDRHRYWDCEQHLYQESRLVCLDTRKPGDKTVPKEKSEVVSDRFKEWMLYPGTLKPTSESMIEDSSLAATRKLRVQEDKAMKESIERQKRIEAQIEAAAKSMNSDSASKGQQGKKRAKKNTTSEVVTSSSKGLREPKVPSASASGQNSSVVTTQDLKQILAEISDLKRLNSQLQSTSRVIQQPAATASKRCNEIDEEDSKLQLANKRRKLAEEELQATKAIEAKTRLELESREHERQLQRESELHRVKLKVQADEIEDESARRRSALADEERRRRYNQEDQQRRQEMEFATEEHALKIHKEKANVRMAASNQQHEQQLQLLYASQQPGNLAMILGNMKSQSAAPTPAEFADRNSFRHASATSSQSIQRNETKTEDAIKNQILQKLMKDLKDEKDIQQRIILGTGGADNGDDEDEEDEEEEEDAT